MTSIIIYTTKEKAKRKTGRKGGVAYWTFQGRPRRFEQGEDIVFLAHSGHIQGYFRAEECWCYAGKRIPDNAVKFRPYGWVELDEKVPTKSFQGFKYADKVPELTEIIKKEIMEE